ncbi:LuxR C-terminal-related transcriptional regulator [Hyphomonas sp. ND6WE1B]|uniref:helix-turn-helix transcriptional regulator n=1 Tax=Hyphomonas sp. ND6WE1B TaxID=1848191 RepID=UPI0015859119|nr:LuxR C-terminal-related transcriptional regulator [Hyphomonas sp. ND6WE1B]
MSAIGNLVEAIGDQEFEERLIGLVERACGADQLYLFQVQSRVPQVRTALSANGSGVAADIAKTYAQENWIRFDAHMREACAHASSTPRLYETDFERSRIDHVRSTFYDRMQLHDRIMMCGRSAGDIIGISILRSVDRGRFDADQRRQVEWIMQFAFPLVSKHWATVNRDRNLSCALTDLAWIERCVAFAPEGLPPRELAVCARYLYGQCTAGISADLEIGRETVITYRKRIYERLGIGSHRELLLWYLDLHGSMRS